MIELQTDSISYFTSIGNNRLILNTKTGYMAYDITTKEYIGKSIDIITNDMLYGYHDGTVVYVTNGEIYSYNFKTEKEDKIILHK